jgi:hypothetical protein
MSLEEKDIYYIARCGAGSYGTSTNKDYNDNAITRFSHGVEKY